MVLLQHCARCLQELSLSCHTMLPHPAEFLSTWPLHMQAVICAEAAPSCFATAGEDRKVALHSFDGTVLGTFTVTAVPKSVAFSPTFQGQEAAQLAVLDAAGISVLDLSGLHAGKVNDGVARIEVTKEQSALVHLFWYDHAQGVLLLELHAGDIYSAILVMVYAQCYVSTCINKLSLLVVVLAAI